MFATIFTTPSSTNHSGAQACAMPETPAGLDTVAVTIARFVQWIRSELEATLK
jgi:hypothetical protein